LLTNNPDKLAQLQHAGIEVRERLPLEIRASTHSDGYLDTKRDRLGHLIG
jgi:3,4-dihydroxy 2-butanone 4-phosphate synthase/GTP cyclohydrolase II